MAKKGFAAAMAELRKMKEAKKGKGKGKGNGKMKSAVVKPKTK